MIQKEPPEAWAEIVDWIYTLLNFLGTWNLVYAFFSSPTTVIAIAAIALTCMQIRYSRIHNRNDRFAKATEMLGKYKSPVSYRGGLYMLRDLIQEAPKTEYIRCIKIIAEWLVDSKSSAALREEAMNIFSGIETKIIPAKALRKIIEGYKKEIGLPYWPDFQKANFSDIHLMRANLELAILAGANFEGATVGSVNFKKAYLSGAKMKTAKKLPKKQILSATWQTKSVKGTPPELPDYLLRDGKGNEDPDIQEWLRNPPLYY